MRAGARGSAPSGGSLRLPTCAPGAWNAHSRAAGRAVSGAADPAAAAARRRPAPGANEAAPGSPALMEVSDVVLPDSDQEDGAGDEARPEEEEQLESESSD